MAAAQNCFYFGLHYALCLNLSAQPVITYFFILGSRVNVIVKLALPEEDRRKNGET